jgi:hypothetical protein
MIVRSSEQITSLVRELRINCDNDACGATFNAQLAIVSIIRTSSTPNPDVRLPFASWPRRPANDDTRQPANDDHGVFAALASRMMT